ncbi:DUF418 domain-containing protein [Lysinibacillus sp. 54212]|uniref:DUF418 domain-containing protein n=1 Tax=Lysinibacillus sp. 54212 TaxID=3119829 RepID=UPI002FC6E375
MKAERINFIDSLRGFALFGVIIINFAIFQYGELADELFSAGSYVDQATYVIITLFFRDSFYAIFIFLLGYSFIKMTESMQSGFIPFRMAIIRRALAFIVVGCIHGMFIFGNDVLLLYGLALFIYLAFAKSDVDTFFNWATVIAIITGIIFLISNFMGDDITPSPSEKEAAIYANGSYAEIFELRLTIVDEFQRIEFASLFAIIIVAVILFFVLSPLTLGPLAFLGMGYARKRIFTDPQNDKALYKKLALMLPVGIVFKAFLILHLPFQYFFFSVGAWLVAGGYIGIFALLYTKYSEIRLFAWLANIGRLSLSMYIMQSIIGVLIFYGFGLGLFGKLGPFAGCLISIAVFLLQVWISQIYLKKFQRGPLEWLLRKWTYLTLEK